LSISGICNEDVSLTQNKPDVVIYTDGACSGNPGPGGWAACLLYGESAKTLCGGEPLTTNNRMELLAVISALEALRRPCEVSLRTDSSYVVNSVEKRWVYGWMAKGWVREGKPVPNADLWRRLLPLLERHSVRFAWLRGHNGDEYNELCDKLAVEQSRRMRDGDET